MTRTIVSDKYVPAPPSLVARVSKLELLFKSLTNLSGGDLTGQLPGPLMQVPYGVLSFTVNVATNNTVLTPSWNAGTVAHGMSSNSSGLIVPKAGLYIVGSSIRCDHSSGYRQLGFTVNVGAIDYDLHSDLLPATSRFSSIYAANAGDQFSVSLYSSAAGTWHGTGAWPNYLWAAYLGVT